MSEQEYLDRTEEATPRKWEEARREGLVPKTPDLSGVAVLLGGVVVLKLWGQHAVCAMLELTAGTLGNMDVRTWDGADLAGSLCGGVLLVLKAMLPILGGLVVAGFLGCVLQTGFLFTGAPMAMRWQRLNPLTGLRALFSGAGLARALKNVLKFAVVGAAVYFTLESQFSNWMGLTGVEAPEIAGFVMNVTLLLLFRVAVALLAVALADYAYERWQFARRMRMTREEVRSELSRMEGDPLTRSRRRRMQGMIAAERMMRGLSRADAVITSSGDVSAAVRYEGGDVHAPILVAKGRGAASRRIREIAEENGVAVVENIPLAEALDRRCEVGGSIPRDLYASVAEVLAFVFEVRREKAGQTASIA